jgi:hypothetical protein
MSGGITINFGLPSGSRYQRQAQFSHPPPYLAQTFFNRGGISNNYSYQP